ncbi:MAG: hypothetical protein AB9891_02890 [Anaerolineaceae bacterium]
MKPSQLNEIKIYLKEVNHLFTPPEFDPFANPLIFTSGLEAAANEINMASRRSQHRLVLFLPGEKITPDLEQTIRQALDNYCSHKLEESRREVSLLRWEGFEALQTGLVFMAVCLFISLYVSKQEVIPEYLQTFVGQGLSVVGWVSMWKPIDIFLYQWWPHWQSRFVYDKIKRAELVIRPR